MSFKAVRGMHDLSGDELLQWQEVEANLKSVFNNFGYQEIRTPILENLEVFKGTVGDETDIVEKQMYLIEKESETLALRPEGTASFMRAILEKGLHHTGQAQRFYYYQPMFRHERPQKGRLRQFHQFGAELIMDPTPEADAELIALSHEIYQKLKITQYEIRINSVGCINCRPLYKEKLKTFFQPHLPELCEVCQKRFERSPLRILDCKKESCQLIAAKAPIITDSICAECKAHHDKLNENLKALNIPFINDPHIVRGLDYYTRTAFEFTSSLLGAQSALSAGGRYDGLSQRFGEKPFPAVGFALGMERLILALNEMKLNNSTKKTPEYFFAPMGDEAFQLLYPLSFELKQNGIWVEMIYDKTKGLKYLFKQADKLSAKRTLVVGEDEIKSGSAQLKTMATGNQENISLKNIKEDLIRRVTSAT